ncbi:MAG: cytochrome c biogenesis protein CcsA, partial [Planctomycetes bacterium]|nr:cytochrome c biogenesis protein CcsA [Planctomycetota bacterium]
TAALTIGIVLRCVIRERPPVTTLYETLLFITATAVISALVIEAFHRRGIAIALAAVLGLFGMYLSNRYEAGRGEDTMPQLIAVLDTNFWLATHVTTISLGYAAGLLGAAIAHVFLFARLFGLKRNEPQFYRSIGRMMFGVACFTLLFSVVGTLLGGIWANESWGRFWGWDPKENGALMICLWTVAMIHAHLGGLIKDRGLAMASVFGGLVVVFSWWGVNLLGVGLHSYGFTSGILRGLVLIGVVEIAILCTGFIPRTLHPTMDQ